MTTKLRKASEKPAVVIEDVKPVNVEPTKLEGSKLVLASSGIEYQKLGFSNVQVVAMAEGLNKVKFDQSLANQVTAAKKQREKVGKFASEFLKNNLVNIKALVNSVIGTAPAKTFSGNAQELNDGSKLTLAVTAVRKNADTENVKAIKDAKSALAQMLFNLPVESGLKQNADLMRLESGTSSDKSISLFDKNTKNALSDSEFTYNISMKISGPIDDKKDC